MIPEHTATNGNNAGHISPFKITKESNIELKAPATPKTLWTLEAKIAVITPDQIAVISH
jgi:hypothetical protein